MTTETKDLCSTQTTYTILGHTFRYIDCSYISGGYAYIEIDGTSVKFSPLTSTKTLSWGTVKVNDCVTCDLGYRGVNITVTTSDSGATHKECNTTTKKCADVAGAGDNKCSSDANCKGGYIIDWKLIIILLLVLAAIVYYAKKKNIIKI